MAVAGKNLVKSGSPSRQIYTLSETLQDIVIQPHLLESNIFIFGKVGFFDLIQKALSKILQKKKKESTILARNLSDLQSAKEAESQVAPVFLVPAAKNKEDLNQLVATAIELKRPVWLVALPSQIEKHLLLSFRCFFIAPHSAGEVASLAEITSLLDEDIEKLCQETSLQAILLMDLPTSLGLPDRLGSVIYIDNLSQ